MQVWEIFVIGVALAMDAVATSLTNGMVEPKMRPLKMLLIAGTFGLFQFGMPLIGYYCSAAFYALVKQIAPWLSFALLVLIGGKMVFDAVNEMGTRRRTLFHTEKKLGAGKLLMQAVATSLDALAVGVTFLAVEASSALPFHAAVCALVIGIVTFVLSLLAVMAGKSAGSRFSEKAELLGGIVLVAIGVKLLLEGVS